MTAPARAPVASRRLRLGRAERREAILAAAAGAFAANGYAATSMAQVARTAGISHLIVYRHFDSKEALYEAVLRRTVGRLERVTAASAARGRYGPGPGALLVAARADPDAFRVLWRHAAREPRFRAHPDAAREHLVATTSRALAPIVGRRHRRWAARATVAYLVEAVLVWVEDGDARLDARFVTATEAALRAGVRAWAQDPPAEGRAAAPRRRAVGTARGR